MWGKLGWGARILLLCAFLLGATMACEATDKTLEFADALARELFRGHKEEAGAPAPPAVPAEEAQQPAAATEPAWAQPEGTVRAPEYVFHMFRDTDCPGTFTGLHSSYGPGSLYCRYHWEGDYGANNAELRITEHKDAGKYQAFMDADIQNAHNAAQSLEANPPVANESLQVLADGPSEYMYVHTYMSQPNSDDPSTALCGEGWGSIGVDEKYSVEVRLEDICGMSANPDDYAQALRNLRDAALAAITRAKAEQGG